MRAEYKDGYRNWWRIEISEEPSAEFTCEFQCSAPVAYRAWDYRVYLEDTMIHDGTVEIEKDRSKPDAQECLTDFMGHMGRVCMGLAVAEALAKPKESGEG